jgi:hypothetical protein
MLRFGSTSEMQAKTAHTLKKEDPAAKSIRELQALAFVISDLQQSS